MALKMTESYCYGNRKAKICAKTEKINSRQTFNKHGRNNFIFPMNPYTLINAFCLGDLGVTYFPW